MNKPQYISQFGSVPSLTTRLLEVPDSVPDLVVQSYAPYRRFAVQVVDDGLDSFGLQGGDYAIFREQRWPTDECQICLVTFGDEVTMRLLEYINNPTITIKVAREKIPDLELGPTDFCVIGVLDGVVKGEVAVLAHPETVEDWGC